MGRVVVKLLAQFILITPEYLDLKVAFFPLKISMSANGEIITCFTGNYKNSENVQKGTEQGLGSCRAEGSVLSLSFSLTEMDF